MIWPDISPKKIYEWLTIKWEDAQHHQEEKANKNDSFMPKRMSIINDSQ